MFDDAIRLQSEGAAPATVAGESERFRGTLAEGWDVLGNVHGGYLLAIAAQAMSLTTGRPDPMTITAHYLSPGRPGDVTVDVETVKAGRRFATARATLAGTDGRTVLSAIGSFGDLSDKVDSLEWTDGAPPKLAPRDECVHLTPEVGSPNFMGQVELLVDPRDIGFAMGTPSGEPRYRGWFRLGEGQEVTTIALLVAIDVFPPTVFNLDIPFGWAPTVELTGHVRSRPVGDWLRCEVSTRFVSSGFMEVDGTYWDETDTLVAQSRQLALLPRG